MPERDLNTIKVNAAQVVVFMPDGDLNTIIVYATQVVVFMPEGDKTRMGGTMRLGSRVTILRPGSRAFSLYGGTGESELEVRMYTCNTWCTKRRHLHAFRNCAVHFQGPSVAALTFSDCSITQLQHCPNLEQRLLELCLHQNKCDRTMTQTQSRPILDRHLHEFRVDHKRCGYGMT